MSKPAPLPAQFLKGTTLLVLAAILACTAYYAVLRATGNFHVVIAGELYRSAQLNPEGLAGEIRRHGIRTVVNLRGANPDMRWYREELEATRLAGAVHVDFGMSARKELTSARAEQLITILRTAEKPVLIHCEAGADRSGLASAIYVSQVAHLGEAAAEAQISLRFGHIGIPYLTSSYAMDESWELLEPLFGIHDS